jgi:hypothetical protein
MEVQYVHVHDLVSASMFSEYNLAFGTCVFLTGQRGTAMFFNRASGF